MKKLMFVLMFLTAGSLNAQDLITGTLLTHVSPVTLFRSGETSIALMDSIVLIGKSKGKSIFDIQGGYKQDSDGNRNGWVAGGFLKVSTLAEPHISLPDHWTFLNSIEFGPFLHYDFDDEKWFGGFQAGLAFELKPKG